MKKNLALIKVIRKVGSMTKLANKLNVSPSFISHLAKGRKKIPARYVKKLVELSEGEVMKKDLRPDLYEIE